MSARHVVLLLGSLALLSACKVVPASPDLATPAGRSTATSVADGDSLRLHVGDSLRVGTDPLVVTLMGVANDSRCPQVVQCVWAGDADVSVRLRGGGESRDAVLHLTQQPRRLEIAGRTVELVGLEPVARSGRPIEQAEYVAVLRVRSTRATPANAALGDTTRILMGQAARFDGGRFVVGFRSIEEESRCPANAICVQMGNAAVALTIESAGTAVGTMVLNTGREPRHLEAAGYDVRLVNLEPYPGTIRPNVRMAASVLLIVTRR